MLNQIVIGRAIAGIRPTRKYAEAVADLVTEKIGIDEFHERIGTAGRANSRPSTFLPVLDDEL